VFVSVVSLVSSEPSKKNLLPAKTLGSDHKNRTEDSTATRKIPHRLLRSGKRRMQSLIYINQVPAYQTPIMPQAQTMQPFEPAYVQQPIAQPRMVQQFQPAMAVPVAQIQPMMAGRE